MGRVILITGDRMGSGDDELGTALMKNFLHSLAREERAPERVLFANSAVRLTCEGSESLEDMRLLAEKGVQIGTCGTCLEHLGLVDSLAVGGVGNMNDLVEMVCSDAQVITIA
jgi:selenium metabolism protein YedF